MNEKQYLAIDVGSSKTGVARASAIARLAQPLKSVDTKEVIPELKKLIEKQAVDLIVVGLPRSLEGSDSDQTRWVREWVAMAKEKINLPFYWQDEALTSKLARGNLTAVKKVDEHSLAAALILQDFLDGSEAERVLI